MKIASKVTIVSIALLLALPAVASPQSRYRLQDGKAFAYRAGFDDGYRDGRRQGLLDYRFHRRFHYQTREYNRADMHYVPQLRYKGDYKKGYKDGYRSGYQNAYRGNLVIRR